MKKPLVSIVMVNYNQEKYIGEAIESVLNQSYNEWELIVVDDGSTDSSKEIIRQFRDERIKPVFLKENRHICYATNMGFSKVTGEYMARLDSDDVWRSEKLDKQIRFLQEHPEEQVVFTQLDIINEASEIINEEKQELYKLYNSRHDSREEWIRFFLFVGNSLIQSSMLMRTSLMKDVGDFNLAYMQAHDFDYFVRMIKKTGFSFIEEPLIGYRRTENQNSSYQLENNRRFFNEHMSIRRHFFEDFPDELFEKTFSSYFINPKAHSHEEFLCEKAFLLEKCIGYSNQNPILGMERFEQLFQDPVLTEILEREYQFTPKEYYKKNSVAQYYLASEMRQIEKKIEDLENHVKVLLELKDMQQMHISKLEESMSCKLRDFWLKIKKIVK